MLTLTLAPTLIQTRISTCLQEVVAYLRQDVGIQQPARHVVHHRRARRDRFVRNLRVKGVCRDDDVPEGFVPCHLPVHDEST